MSRRDRLQASVAGLVLLTTPALAQVTPQDYPRALGLREAYQYLTVNVPEPATWIEGTSRFYYRKSVEDGHAFVRVDAETLERPPAFDHARLAAALGAATGDEYTPVRLPFSAVTFVDGDAAVEVAVEGTRWRCTLSDYSCGRADVPARTPGLGGPVRNTEAPVDTQPRRSTDGAYEAFIRNYNVAVRTIETGEIALLSSDGSEGNYYDLASLVWSPDSTRIAAYRVRPGHRRVIHFVESSPEDQVQPKHSTFQYTKPGDALDLEQPVLFHVPTRAQLPVANDLFPNPYDLTPLVWRADGRAVTFEYNQRGHQTYRVIEVDAATGAGRASSSRKSRGRSSTTTWPTTHAAPASASATTWMTGGRWCGCRSVTAGTTCT